MSEYFPFSPETSTESDKDKGPESSKSKKKKSFEIGKAAAPAIIEAPKFDTRKEVRQSDKIAELLHRRPFGEKEANQPASEVEKPDTVETAESRPKLNREARGEDNAERTAEVPLESMATSEEHEAVKPYLENQREALGLESLQADAELADEPARAETATDLLMIEAVEANLAANPDMPVAEAVDKAGAEVTERIEAAAEDARQLIDETAPGEADASEAANSEAAGPETASPDEPEAVPGFGEVPLDGDEDEIVLHPVPAGSASAGVAGGSSSGDVPPRGPSGPAAGGMPPLGPGGPGFGPGMDPSTGPSGPNFNAVPSAPEVIEVQDITAERRAMAQGVLVGGIVGYLLGRRRGRIKTEKRLKPIQRKLEKQVTELHQTVAAREQSIRSLARQKSESLAVSRAARQRFAERLAASTNVPAGRRAESFGERMAERSERLTTNILEAPAVIIAAAATLRSERGRDTEPAVNFTKKVEAYTPQELGRAAEKIKIDGTTLKEIASTHNLDERAVRRVIGEFIAGGNVKEALTREMVEKEMQFERDPRLRQAKQSAQLSGAGAGGRPGPGDVPVSDNADGAEAQNGHQGTGRQSSGSGKKPTPDQATIDKLRKQQITQISIASAIVIMFALVIAALLG